MYYNNFELENSTFEVHEINKNIVKYYYTLAKLKDTYDNTRKAAIIY